jgi:uncharacterized protein
LTRLQLACLVLVIGAALPLTVTLRHALAPSPVPSVLDGAALLSEAERRSIASHHDRLLADHDIDYRVVTALAAGDVDRAGHEAFAALGVGERSRSGRGLLLLIDPSADRVRLEVAAGLEGVFTDAFVAYLEQRQMVPFFRNERVAEGILATTELIVARAQEAAAGAGFDPTSVASFSLGGGASTAARIGAGPDHTRAQDGSQVAPDATPEATVAAYLAAMAARNGRPDLAVYSEESRRMLGSWTMTPAQMDSVVRTYRSCPGGEVRYGDGADLAVIRYAPAARHCSPWFLKREGGRWTLDLAATQRVIRFNHRNQWRMPDPDGHAYAFAFADWRFDRHGFPIELR